MKTDLDKITRGRIHASDFAQKAESLPRPAIVAIVIILLCILAVAL